MFSIAVILITVKECVIPHFISRRVSLSTPSIIPRQIWQTHNTRVFKEPVCQNINTLLSYSSEYDYRLYNDDEMINSLIHFPKLQKIVKSLKIGAFKADIWRFAMMYAYGGIYVDFDSEFTANISTVILNTDSFVVIPMRDSSLGHYVLISAAKNPVFKCALDRAEKLYENMATVTLRNYKDFAGPTALSRCAHLAVDVKKLDMKSNGIVKMFGSNRRTYYLEEKSKKHYWSSIVQYHQLTNISWMFGT